MKDPWPLLSNKNKVRSVSMVASIFYASTNYLHLMIYISIRSGGALFLEEGFIKDP